MQLMIEADGSVRCVYGEVIDLSALGRVQIKRGSHVEPDERGHWFADLEPVQGPRLGSFEWRSEALAAEVSWLATNWLLPDQQR